MAIEPTNFYTPSVQEIFEQQRIESELKHEPVRAPLPVETKQDNTAKNPVELAREAFDLNASRLVRLSGQAAKSPLEPPPPEIDFINLDPTARQGSAIEEAQTSNELGVDEEIRRDDSTPDPERTQDVLIDFNRVDLRIQNDSAPSLDRLLETPDQSQLSSATNSTFTTGIVDIETDETSGNAEDASNAAPTENPDEAKLNDTTATTIEENNALFERQRAASLDNRTPASRITVETGKQREGESLSPLSSRDDDTRLASEGVIQRPVTDDRGTIRSPDEAGVNAFTIGSLDIQDVIIAQPPSLGKTAELISSVTQPTIPKEDFRAVQAPVFEEQPELKPIGEAQLGSAEQEVGSDFFGEDIVAAPSDLRSFPTSAGRELSEKRLADNRIEELERREKDDIPEQKPLSRDERVAREIRQASLTPDFLSSPIPDQE